MAEVGSDLSAVALSSSLKANKCEIYTDVDGVFSTDPRIIQNATLLKNISYDEMLEAASSGAKVLHNRCVNVAKSSNLDIYVKNTFNNTMGTVVSSKNYHTTTQENFSIKIISKIENLTKISIIADMIFSENKIIFEIFDIAKQLNTKIHMISFSDIAINILVDNNAANLFIEKLNNLTLN